MHSNKHGGKTNRRWNVAQGMLSGLVLGFFGPFIILSIPVVIVINVLIFAIRRTMPGLAFPICLLIGAILGYIGFLFWFGSKMSHMGALG